MLGISTGVFLELVLVLPPWYRGLAPWSDMSHDLSAVWSSVVRGSGNSRL
jgi:hypothetical protein